MSGIPSAFLYLLARDSGEFKESDHPRGQPENAGEFASTGGSSSGKSSESSEKTSSGSKRLGTLSKDDTQLEFIRSKFQEPTEAKALDVLGSWLDHGSIQGYDDLVRYHLEEQGVDLEHLEKVSDADLRKVLSKKPEILSGKWSKDYPPNSMFPPDSLMVAIQSEEGQMKMADMLIEATKQPGAFKSKDNKISPVQSLLEDLGHSSRFRGDVLDHLADGVGELPHGVLRSLLMYSKDYDKFLPAFVGSWSIMGGTNAYRRAYVAVGGTDGNANKKFWAGSNPLTAGEKVVSKNMQANLQKLHQVTQDFYTKKLTKRGKPKPDLSQEMLTIQRGVSGHFDSYTPAAVESWTTDKATPVRFGKLMSGGDGKYSVLTAQVPYSSVLFSYESLKGVWPPEKELKGKKEFAVFGGGLVGVAQETFQDQPKYRQGYR